MKTKMILMVVITLLIVCVICSVSASNDGISEEIVVTAMPEIQTDGTLEALMPTEIVGNTVTPAPTNTPLPTATPSPSPIVLQGTGDMVLDVEKWVGPAIAKIIYTGGGNFVVLNYAKTGDRLGLLVNTIGSYEGTVPIDFIDRQHTSRLEVRAAGSWEIQILPSEFVRRETVPGIFTGTGDDVIALEGLPDLLKVSAEQAKGNFVIVGYGNRRSLVVNEIAPYAGTVILNWDTVLIVVIADGDWQFEVTAQ